MLITLETRTHTTHKRTQMCARAHTGKRCQDDFVDFDLFGISVLQDAIRHGQKVAEVLLRLNGGILSSEPGIEEIKQVWFFSNDEK